MTMTMTKRSLVFVALLLAAMAQLSPAQAAGEAEPLPQHDWSFAAFGTFDRGALQRGFQVYRQVCSACHGIKRVAFRNLADLGYSAEEIKAIAAEYQVTDGPQ
jgi:cytochrome c1